VVWWCGGSKFWLILFQMQKTFVSHAGKIQLITDAIRFQKRFGEAS